MTKELNTFCLQLYQLMQVGRTDYNKLLEEIKANNGTDPMNMVVFLFP
jgi:hypothetical protein